MTPARVVSVDLAYRRERDIGVCVLTRSAGGIDSEFVSLASAAGATHPPTAQWVAEACAALAESRGAQLLLLDGSQAWKDPANGHLHARSCERALHTPAKTGEPGHVKPRPYTAFIAFSVAVFDALHALGWPRLESATAPHGRSVEVFPHAAWQRFGLTPLPAKAKCETGRLAEAHQAIRGRANIQTNRTPSHDELQALVAGIAGLALLERTDSAFELLGTPPFRSDGHWREGFILAPRRSVRANDEGTAARETPPTPGPAASPSQSGATSA